MGNIGSSFLHVNIIYPSFPYLVKIYPISPFLSFFFALWSLKLLKYEVLRQLLRKVRGFPCFFSFNQSAVIECLAEERVGRMGIETGTGNRESDFLFLSRQLVWDNWLGDALEP